MITDRLEFRTIGGAEELLTEELREAGLTELSVAERRVTGTLTGDPDLLTDATPLLRGRDPAGGRDGAGPGAAQGFARPTA